MENDKPKRGLLITFHDFKVGGVVAIVIMALCAYYKSKCEQDWKLKWARMDAVMEIGPLETYVKDQGMSFAICSPDALIAKVKADSNNVVNNVWYVGRKDGFAHFIHNSDSMTQRFRVSCGKLYQNYEMPVTNAVREWLRVTGAPSSAAADLSAFLSGAKLPPRYQHPK